MSLSASTSPPKPSSSTTNPYNCKYGIPYPCSHTVRTRHIQKRHLQLLPWSRRRLPRLRHQLPIKLQKHQTVADRVPIEGQQERLYIF
jgi:hypothetical protein